MHHCKISRFYSIQDGKYRVIETLNHENMFKFQLMPSENENHLRTSNAIKFIKLLSKVSELILK